MNTFPRTVPPTPARVTRPASRARRQLLLAAALAPWTAWARPSPRISVWKDPNCGCCNDWITHLQQHGFEVVVAGTSVQPMKERLGVPRDLWSCHTAVVGPYFLEGHVPATEVRRLVSERPAALGLAVPGMPVGSPGMDGPAHGPRRDAYEVWLVRRAEAPTVYRRYPGG